MHHPIMHPSPATTQPRSRAPDVHRSNMTYRLEHAARSQPYHICQQHLASFPSSCQQVHGGGRRGVSCRAVCSQVRDLSDRGFKEVTLLGQNVNSYAHGGGAGATPSQRRAALRSEGAFAAYAQVFLSFVCSALGPDRRFARRSGLRHTHWRSANHPEARKLFGRAYTAAIASHNAGGICIHPVLLRLPLGGSWCGSGDTKLGFLTQPS